MKKGNFILAISLLLLVVIAGIIILQWYSAVDTPEVSIPSPIVTNNSGDTTEKNTPLEISADTVQRHIASISRPNAYSRKYKVTIFWEGGEADAEISVYRNNERFLEVYVRGNQTKSTLFENNKVHYWYDGVKPVVTVVMENADTAFLDLYSSLLVYEKLQEVSTDDILEAKDEVYLDESCIYVEYRYSDRYTYQLHISVEKGLLVGAQVLENGKNVYSLETISTDMSVPPDDVFAIPK